VESIGYLRGDELANSGRQIVDALKQGGRLPMQTDNLHFAVDGFRNRQDAFIKGMSGNRKFLVDSVE
jgi:hypothetical protein